jgi:hypothetical protein
MGQLRDRMEADLILAGYRGCSLGRGVVRGIEPARCGATVGAWVGASRRAPVPPMARIAAPRIAAGRDVGAVFRGCPCPWAARLRRCVVPALRGRLVLSACRMKPSCGTDGDSPPLKSQEISLDRVLEKLTSGEGNSTNSERRGEFLARSRGAPTAPSSFLRNSPPSKAIRRARSPTVSFSPAQEGRSGAPYPFPYRTRHLWPQTGIREIVVLACDRHGRETSNASQTGGSWMRRLSAVSGHGGAVSSRY